MANPDRLEQDVELELARRLERADGDIPESMLNQLTPKELEEFRYAHECLKILEYAEREQNENSTGRLQETLTDRSFELTMPSQLGKFRIIRQLGSGGFGVVFLAIDESLDREVAIKIPRSQQLVGEKLKRFEREARAAAILSHPAILPVHEAGCLEALPYIASVYCDGQTLSQWQARQDQSIDPKAAARIVSKLADAVQHAHSRGIIHRDLKPANVLVEKREQRDDESNDLDGLTDSLRITDFGLARFVDEGENLTREGALVGTPAYMSPEQARGDNEKISAATDIYALGAILYELLTGKPPITGENNAKTIRAIECQSPTPPSSINSNVDRDLEAICFRCLEKEPRSRYSSADELSKDLGRYVSGESVVARKANAVERAWKWAKREPWAATVAASFVLVLCVASVLSTTFWLAAESNRKRANQNSELADRRLEQALKQNRDTQAAISDLMERVTNAPEIRLPRMSQYRDELTKGLVEVYAVLRDNQPDDEALLREYVKQGQQISRALVRLGDHSAAEPMIDDLIEVAENQRMNFSQLELFKSKTLILMASDRYEQGLKFESKMLDLAKELSSENPERWGLTHLRAINTATRNHLFLKNISSAERVNDEGLLLASRISTDSDADQVASELSISYANRACIDYHLANFESARKNALFALELIEGCSSTTACIQAKSRALDQLGLIDGKLGEFDRGVEYHQQAIDILETETDLELFDNFKVFVDRQYNLAGTLLRAGRYAQVEVVAKKGLQSAHQASAMSPEYFDKEIGFYYLLANAYFQTGQLKRLQRILEQGLKQSRTAFKDLGTKNPHLASLHASLLNLQSNYFRLYDEAEKAIAPAEDSLGILEELIFDNNLLDGRVAYRDSLNNAFYVYHRADDHERACELGTRFLKEFPHAATVPLVRQFLLTDLIRVGRIEFALRIYENESEKLGPLGSAWLATHAAEAASDLGRSHKADDVDVDRLDFLHERFVRDAISALKSFRNDDSFSMERLELELKKFPYIKEQDSFKKMFPELQNGNEESQSDC